MAQITSGSLTIVDVTDGAPGLNNTTVFLYRRAVSAPDKPTGNLTYTFATASITGALEGWVQSINELTGSDPIWMIAAVASSNGETDIIESSEWAGPIKMAQNGQDGLPGAPGTNGLNQATIFIYKRADSATAPSSTTYTFATGGFTVPSGWSKTIPTEPKGKPCWVTSAIAIGAEATAELNWVAPSVLVEDGSDGTSPTVTATENGVKIVDADGNETFITNGADGTSYYTFVRYSKNANGSEYVVTPTSETIYIGVYTGTKSSPPAYNDDGWTWSRYVGANGQPGAQGPTGPAGPQGVSVAATRELYYLKTNSTDPAQITNANQIHTDDDVNQWTSVVPTYIGSGKYYTCIETTLSNGNVVWSAPVENKGLTDANVNAMQAVEIARGVKQHFFWVSTDISDDVPSGAYVAEQTEQSFYSGPTKGNILTRSDGIWIRNGVDKLAVLRGEGLTFLVPKGTHKGQKSITLDGSGLTFYNIGSSNSAAATLASDGLQIENGSIILGGHGTSGINAGDVALSNKNFTRSINNIEHKDLRFAIGSKFGVASDGTLYASGADIRGKVTITAGSNVYTTDDVNPLEIGGRNLLTGTSESKELTTAANQNWFAPQPYKLSAFAGTAIADTNRTDITISFDYSITGVDTAFNMSASLRTSTASGGTYAAGVKVAEIPVGNSSGHAVGTRNITSDMRNNAPGAGIMISGSGNANANAVVTISNVKLEFGNKATDWTPAPEDVDATIAAAKAEIKITTDGISAEVSKKVGNSEVISKINQSAETVKIQASKVAIDGSAVFSNTEFQSSLSNSQNAYTILWDRNYGTDAAGGEAIIQKKDPLTGVITNAAGWVIWNGTKRTVPAVEYNPNAMIPYNIPVYLVLRLSSASSTTGTVYPVWYANSKWNYLNKGTNAATTDNAVANWTWVEATDIVLGSCVEPAGETIFTDCVIYDPPWTCKQVTSDTVTARSANAAAAAAQTTANNAAPKSSAVAEEQLIYISKASGTSSVAANTTWVTETGDKQNTWSTKRPTYNSSYPVLFVAKQKKVVSGTVTCTTPVKDDTTTIIDGGHITTGTIDASKATITNINASNISSGTLSADRIAAGALAIGKLNTDTQNKINNGNSALTKVNYYNRTCHVGNSSNTQTAYWRKFASYVETRQNADPFIIFDVMSSGDMSTYKQFGRLKAHVRTSGTVGTVDAGHCTLQWITKGEGINLPDFVMAYKATSGTDVKVELWCKCDKSWTGYRFNMVQEGDRTVEATSAMWTLYDSFTANGLSAITSGYTQVVSTYIDAAKDTADNYIYMDSSGIRIASANPSSQKQRLYLTSSEAALYSSDDVKRVSITSGTGVVVGNALKGHTVVNDAGLYIYDTNNKKRSQTDANGLHVYGTDGSTEVALFGATARLGTASGARVVTTSSGIQVYNASNEKRAEFGGDWALIGNPDKSRVTINTTDDSSYIYMNSNGASVFRAASDGVRVGNYDDSTTANRHYTYIKSDGLHVYQANTEVASFGSTARIGKTANTNIYIDPSGPDSGIKFRTNGNGITGLTIADIGFDSTAGWTDPEKWPKGAWYTFGYRSGTKGYYSFVSGFNNIASHNASVAFGVGNKVYAPMAMAIGSSNTIGNNSAASSVSDYNDTIYTPSCNSSLAVGWGLKVTAEQQVVTGYYNATVSDAQLIIGNGTNDSTRKNSFVVYKTGNVVAAGSMTVSGHSTPIGATLTASQTSARGSGTDLGNLSSAYIDIPAGTWVITLNCRGDLNSSEKRLQFEFYNSTDSTEYTSTRVTCHSSNTGPIGGMSVLVVYVSKTTRFYCRCYQNSGASVDLTAAFRAARIA